MVPLVALIFGFTISKHAFVTSAFAGITASLIWNKLLQPIFGFDGTIFGVLVNTTLFILFYQFQKSASKSKPKISPTLKEAKPPITS